MLGETDQVVGSLGRELVLYLAPEELPLYPSLLNDFQGGKRGGGRKRSSDDQLLGFGAAEAVTMITPVILTFSRGFWEALIAETAREPMRRLAECIRAHLPGHHEIGQVPQPLTPEQLHLVRRVAEREARRLDLPDKRARLLADAMVGVLSVPPAPMSTAPPDQARPGEPAGPPAEGGSAGRRGGVFLLPASTSFRFALLIATVLVSSAMVYEALYGATPRGAAVATLIRACQARALASHPGTAAAYARALAQARACRAGTERVVGLWVLLALGVLAVLAGVLYWLQPWWYRRQRQLVPLTSQDAPSAVERLEQLRHRAGIGPVAWLQQPLDFQPSAFAFGRFRRRCVAISGGAIVAQGRQPVFFDAIVLHELSHIRNRDIDQTYLAVAIWRAFVVAALLPMAGLLIFSRQLGSPPRLLWRVAVLALMVYLLRNAILRAREFGADARVAELDPDTALGAVLAALPPRRGQQLWHLGWLHPSGSERAAALLDPAPLFRSGFWDGLAMGLVGALGAEAAQNLVYLLWTAKPIGSVGPAFVFALLSGAALAAAVWRMRFWDRGLGAGRVWAVGLGFGLGVAFGPVLTLTTVFYHGVAPDSLQTGAFIVLAIWVVLTTVLFVSVPAWIGYWADAWQQRSQRLPARGGLVIATVGAWIVLALGLALMVTNFTLVVGFSAGTKAFLEQNWTYFGSYVAQQSGAWVVGLVLFAVPLSGVIVGLRLRGALLWVQPVVLTCLAGAVLVIAVTLATAAAGRADIAPAVRWNALYFTDFLLNGEQMVILVAVLVALAAAVWLRSAQAAAIALAVGAVVAVLGILAMFGSLALGNCVSTFSITYDRAPTGICHGYPGSLAWPQLFPAAVEAVLIGILVIPAAHDGAVLLARRHPRRAPGRSAKALRGLAAVAVAVAVTIGVAMLVPEASAHGIRPTGTIGQDGWIYGVGYKVRMFPNWYDLTPATDHGDILVSYDGSFSDTIADFTLESVLVPPNATITGTGGRMFLLAGAPGETFVFPNVDGDFVQRWVLIRGTLGYELTFRTPLADRADRAPDITQMLKSWRWTGVSTPG